MSILNSTTKIVIYIFYIQIFSVLFQSVNSYSINTDLVERDVIYKEEATLEKYKTKDDEEKWDVEDVEGYIHNFDDDYETVNIDDIMDEKKFEKRASKISSSEYYWAQLVPFEKKIYNVVNNISNKSKLTTLAVKVTNLKSLKIKKSNVLKNTSRSVGALIRDHPEYWWIKKYSISYSSSSNYITEIKINLQTNFNLATINSRKTKVTNQAKAIAKEANKKNTYYKKLKYIHDYLIKFIKYDAKNEKTTYNIYGALIEKKCSCEGYAESFTYLARMVGVGTISVSGETHKWNYVYLKNKWYVVDVTFDDPIVNKKVAAVGSTSNMRNNFFLIGSNTVVDKKKGTTYTKYSDRKLTKYVEFTNATGFTYPTLSKTQYS